MKYFLKPTSLVFSVAIGITNAFANDMESLTTGDSEFNAQYSKLEHNQCQLISERCADSFVFDDDLLNEEDIDNIVMQLANDQELQDFDLFGDQLSASREAEDFYD